MDPYLGQISIFAFRFAPAGWAFCDGAKLTIQQNAALYSLFHNYYGGDQATYFNLPDMRGRTPMHGYLGTQPTYGGAETVAIVSANIPGHTHSVGGSTAVGTSLLPSATAGNMSSVAINATTHVAASIYAPLSNAVPLNPATVSTAGTGGGHNNMQPFAVLNFCIAKTGVYPQRS